MSAREPRGRLRVTVVAAALFHALSLLCHAGASVAVLALLPQGFPPPHPRFFANSVLPSALFAGSLTTLVLLRLRPRVATAWLAAFPTAWLGVALSTALTFPTSGAQVRDFAAMGALCLSIGYFFWFGSFRPRATPQVIPPALFGLLLGMVLPRTQRAPDPTTIPSPTTPPLTLPAEAEIRPVDAVVRLTPSAQVALAEAEVEAQFGRVRLRVQPLLEFESISPDRFWTLFTKQRSERRALTRAARSDSVLALAYAPERALSIESLPEGALQIDATTRVPSEIFSHLNSFTTLLVSGHRRLGVRFSVFPELTLEVTHADYPVGAPASFAYLDEREVLRVVRATSAEKGPYVELASGPLPRGASLGISIVELAEMPPSVLGEIHFDDWTRQLSTALSPTAGFGVPENAIQFGLASTDPTSTAYFVLNLAGTSVGRGWDSVGHRAGLYRNRIRLSAR